MDAPNSFEPERAGPSPSRLLRAARRRRRWTQARLVAELERVARANGEPVASPASLKAMVSRWERGRSTPDDHNGRLLCQALGIREDDLGVADDSV